MWYFESDLIKNDSLSFNNTKKRKFHMFYFNKNFQMSDKPPTKVKLFNLHRSGGCCNAYKPKSGKC